MDVASLRVMFTAGGDGSVNRAIDGVNRKLDTVDGHAKRAGGALDSMFKVAGGVLLAQGITKIGQLAGGILSAHSNAEQLRTSLEIAVGSVSEANAIFGELQKIAAATPFQFPELVESAMRLESFGVDSLDVMDTLGDTAAGMGKSLEQVTAAYLDAGMGQFIRLQELGIDAAVVGDEVKFRWIENGKQMEKSVDKNNQALIRSTLEAIWNTKYEGAMAKQSRTFLGQWSTLKDNATLAMMDMTEGVFSSLTEILDFTNEVFSDGMVNALRNIAGPLEGLGDTAAAVIEAFGSGRGLDAILSELPESWQGVAGTILAISDALGDLKVAFDTGGFGGLLDQLGGELSNILDAGLDLGEIAVRFAWGELTQVGESLWQKVIDYTGLAGVSDATGGPGAPTLPFTTVDVLVAGVIKLGGDLDDIGASVAEALGIARTDADMTAAREEGRLLGQDIWDSFTGGIVSGVGGEGGGDPAGKAAKLNTIAERIVQMTNPFMQIKAIYESDTIFAEWMQMGVGIGEGMVGALLEGLSSAFNGTETMASRLNPFSEGAVMEGGVAGWLQDTADSIIQEFKDLPGDIAEGVGTLSLDVIPQPTLPSWLSTNWDWILDPIETLTGYINDLLGLVSQAISARATADSAMGVQPLMPFGMGGDAPRMSINRQLEEDVIDVNPVVKLMPQFDVSGVGAAADTALANVRELTSATYSATLDADSGPFAVKYTEASGWGDVFANQTWTATFDADNGPAAVAYTEAFGWGNVWASQVFTARFSIDTSGLAAAEQAALATAQRIRDILPSSPAKKGPFAGPVPSLNYIADSFKASFARMESDAERGMANVRSAMGGGRGGGGGASGMTINHPTYHIYPETGDLHREITAAAVGDWR